MARVPLAWRQLTAAPQRLALSAAGIGFAVWLMFMQTGFQNSILDSSARMVPRMRGDLILAHKLRYTVDQAKTFSRGRLAQALRVPGVAAAVPLYVTNAGQWKVPATGTRVAIRVYGVHPDEPTLDVPEWDALRGRTRVPGLALFDTLSRPYYGRVPDDGQINLNDHPVRIVGGFEMGPDFTADGNLLVSTETYFAVFAGTKPDDVDYGLLQLAPGADPAAVRAGLRAALPDEVIVYTKDEYVAEINRYLSTTGATAVIFGLGVTISFVIGAFVCYQVLFNDVTDHLPQFATLKAMGYTTLALVLVVVQEALLLAVFGFAVGLLPSYLLAVYVETSTGLVMRFGPERLATIFGLTVAMNQLAGLIAVRKVIAADPVDCF